MTRTITDRYPRTLYEWLKTDDKALRKALADGQSVLEAAEDLQREHITVLQRLQDLELIEFREHSEEWVEVMSLALDGVPMQSVIAWCNADETRPSHEEITSMAMSGLRTEFELARELGITVPNSDSLTDLTWLTQQPPTIQFSYEASCRTLIEAFDVVTPTTLKNQVLGLVVQKPGCIRAVTTTTSGFSAHRYPKSGTKTTSKKVYRKKRSSTSSSWGRKRRARSPSYA